MTRAEFDDLVRQMEARLAGRPAALERETGAWMALGLAGFLGWVGLLFAIGVAAFAAGVVLPFEAGIWLLIVGVALVLYAISQAFVFLATDHAPARGHALRRTEAPALHSLLDSLRGGLQCRPFDDIRITMEFNAGIREVPRLGFLGWPRSILEIGLPLMEVLDVDEIRAVLAHELAHTSARHARSSARIYRVHRTWAVLFQQMQRPARGSFDRAIRSSANRFSRWYWPRLHARAMVLSRAHEYHADRVASECAGAASAVAALWKLECWQPMLAEQFWAEVFREAERSPDPPGYIFERMRLAFRTTPTAGEASLWIDRAISRTTGHDETHPSFQDRARALGVAIETIRQGGFPEAPGSSAAEVLLGDDRIAIEAELAGEWRRSVMAGWRQRHRRSAVEARRQGEPAGPETGSDSAATCGDVASTWESARSCYESRGPEAAEPLLREVLVRDPNHPGAGVVLGSHLLKRGDPEGRRLLERVAEQAEEYWVRQACQVLHDHFRVTGQAEEHLRMRTRLDRLDEESEAAQRERATVRAGDCFVLHGLTDVELGPMRAVLAGQPDCGAAWLVRKAVKYQRHRPLFVLSVWRKSGRWWGGGADRDRELVRRLTPLVQLPGQTLIVGRYGSFKALANRVRLIPGSEVFRWDRPTDPVPASHRDDAG